MTEYYTEFKEIADIEYFDFEEDFVEKNIRCIPMIVRFKMDAAGIKLKLSEWSLFSIEERKELTVKSCCSAEEAGAYVRYLSGLIQKYTGNEATALAINKRPEWDELNKIPFVLYSSNRVHYCEFFLAYPQLPFLWQDGNTALRVNQLGFLFQEALALVQHPNLNEIK